MDATTPTNDAKQRKRRERITVVSLLFALAVALSFAAIKVPDWLGWNLGHCEAACRAGCNRDRECGGYTSDCNTACATRCKGRTSPAGDGTKECIERLRALSCDDIARIGVGDISPVKDACGTL